METLGCRDVGFDCEGVIQAATQDEVMAQAAEHAQSVYGVNVTSEMAGQLQELIREE